jgi:single-stranded DNA-binding protein
MPGLIISSLEAKIKNRPSRKQSLNGKNCELVARFRATCWHKLAEAANEFLVKGQQVIVEGELRGDTMDGSQNPRIWTGNDGPASRRPHRASYEVSARTVKFPAQQRRTASSEGNGGAPVDEPLPRPEIAIPHRFR